MWTCTNANCQFHNEDHQYKCDGCGASKPYPTAPGELPSDVASADQIPEVHFTAPVARGSQKIATQRDVRKAIRRLCDECGKDDGHNKPLNIVLIGKPGVGKSEFMNSIAAALSQDKWRHYVDSGTLPNSAAITFRTRRYPKCCNKDVCSDVLLPTLIDVAGLSDEGGAAMTELLTLLCYGHIKEGDAIQNVYKDCKNEKLTKQDVRYTYRKTHADMRIDRVIFVATCEDSLPKQLMTCVRSVVKPHNESPCRREIPLFGILTKKDNVSIDDPDFKKRMKDFKLGLGLTEPHLLVCTNYCDKIDPNNERLETLRPDLDLPIVKFFQQVCSGAMSVACDDDTLNVPGPLYSLLKLMARHWILLTVLIFIIIACIIFYRQLPPYRQSYEDVHEACLSGRVNDKIVCNTVKGHV